MNAIRIAMSAASLISTLKTIPATCAAIQASRAERKFYEELIVKLNGDDKPQPIRVKCVRLA